MKPYATEAYCFAENPDTGLKTYRIIYVGSDGNTNQVVATGRDMSSALRTVIRQAQKDRLASVPTELWALLSVLLIAAFSVTAVYAKSPLLTVFGGGFGLTALYLLLEKHFKYTK